MTRSLEALVVGKVIGEVVDMFSISAELRVRYGTKQVTNGCHINPSLAADKPNAHISGPPNTTNLYTLVMVDPDAPSPSEPTLREWLHWVVVDIPQGCDASKGNELVAYMGPKPPTGIHRYVFVLFRQRTGSQLAGLVQPHEHRANFNTRHFAAQYGLELPVAAVYFNSQKEPSNSRKR